MTSSRRNPYRRGNKRKTATPRKPTRARARTPASAAPAPQPSAPAAAPEDRVSLVARVQAMVERQIEAAETMLPLPETPDESERNSRALAGLLRTLRELKRLESPPAPFEPADDDDVPPQDLEELRRELSRKLEAIVAGREGAVCCEP
ncbi:MAG TPA: hypothetical protein VFA53_03505 [Xanthobacteraceae bacterium]|nr:hypothetical protein [Xanthobacteraceae bacterium]